MPDTWHWLYTHKIPSPLPTRSDGHPTALPPGVPETFTQRLWAGSHIQLHKEVQSDSRITFRCELEPVILKYGRRGPLAFSPIQIRAYDGEHCLLSERRTNVYRRPIDGAVFRQDDTRPPQLDRQPFPVVSRRIHLDEMALLQYSSLLGISNRIHYDYPYATKVEGYPGLVIQGPLIAQLLTHQARDLECVQKFRSISVLAIAPHFLGTPFYVNATRKSAHSISAWASDGRNSISMRVDIELH